MGWEQHHRRTEAIDAVLDRARSTGRCELSAAEDPEIPAVFGTADELLAALRYKWSLIWHGHFERELHESGGTDPGESARRAQEMSMNGYPALWDLLVHNGFAELDAGGAGASRDLPRTPPASRDQLGEAFERVAGQHRSAQDRQRRSDSRSPSGTRSAAAGTTG